MTQNTATADLSRLRLRLDLILDAVAKETGVSVSAIKGVSRVEHIAEARHLACYVARQTTNASFRDLALMVGKTNHANAMNSVSRIADALTIEAEAANKHHTSRPRAERIARIMQAVGGRERALNLSTK